jgi:uncharacterized protein
MRGSESGSKNRKRERIDVNDLMTSLTEADIARLKVLLRRVSPNAMALDALDGFFCALVCGPGKEPARADFSDVLGADLDDEDSASCDLVDAKELSMLMLRHWNVIAAAMLAGKPYVPLFALDDEGYPDGGDWAMGFQQGMNRNPAEWDRLTKDKDDWIAKASMRLLLEQYPLAVSGFNVVQIPPISPEKRMELLTLSSGCLSHIFQYFHRDAGKAASMRR